jgi:hypothetical protein
MPRLVRSCDPNMNEELVKDQKVKTWKLCQSKTYMKLGRGTVLQKTSSDFPVETFTMIHYTIRKS